MAIFDEFAGWVLLCKPLLGPLGSEPPPILPPPPHPAIRIIPAAETAAVALRAFIVLGFSHRRPPALVRACATAHLPMGPSSFNRAGLVKRELVTFRTTPPLARIFCTKSRRRIASKGRSGKGCRLYASS